MEAEKVDRAGRAHVGVQRGTADIRERGGRTSRAIDAHDVGHAAGVGGEHQRRVAAREHRRVLVRAPAPHERHGAAGERHRGNAPSIAQLHGERNRVSVSREARAIVAVTRIAGGEHGDRARRKLHANEIASSAHTSIGHDRAVSPTRPRGEFPRRA